MSRYIVVLIVVVFALLMGMVPVVARPLEQNDIVPINGLAYWGTEPTGPDFEGVELRPFQAQNPDQATWKQTQRQNERFHNTAESK